MATRPAPYKRPVNAVLTQTLQPVRKRRFAASANRTQVSALGATQGCPRYGSLFSCLHYSRMVNYLYDYQAVQIMDTAQICPKSKHSRTYADPGGGERYCLTTTDH
jgi:hypothetical protein